MLQAIAYISENGGADHHGDFIFLPSLHELSTVFDRESCMTQRDRAGQGRVRLDEIICTKSTDKPYGRRADVPRTVTVSILDRQKNMTLSPAEIVASKGSTKS